MADAGVAGSQAISTCTAVADEAPVAIDAMATRIAITIPDTWCPKAAFGVVIGRRSPGLVIGSTSHGPYSMIDYAIQRTGIRLEWQFPAIGWCRSGLGMKARPQHRRAKRAHNQAGNTVRKGRIRAI